ncbi:MAG: bifunctional diaminohydroxyphosphoribosylaminopyrimidine deaminase/5-amino-6-(5-phosphoribosylamino)uracil reductase RibD [Bacteroidales bacterium]|jgi:diaminohydroxyphosphoribosylaminopyrimidine deaminase/5-amino-6-(5-phosphoribosylamino)uracil reductase|nr:bifunctional diaminohydroxyphosphoribosylaminopyrimidine deaminase/5-amino-6-(5-phosphoribosylamino)uracil reductase RibD [Bacteroidales bacterium]
MTSGDDLKFMRRCLDLALKAEGRTYPNPLVGSVIVREGLIIGEGYHVKAGEPHAEIMAIESVKDRTLLKSSALYVNLEPCSHHGKTPPCADRIIAEGIPVVFLGTKDTSDKVAGKGISRLREAGCRVVVGVAEDECRSINKRFFSFHEKKRPYIVLKWAQSADGFIDIERGESPDTRAGWITGEPERVLVHKWRSEEQSILIGAGTLRNDDPLLNVRYWKGKNPVRLVLSGSGTLPEKPSMTEIIGSQVVFTFFPEKVEMPGSVVVKLNTREASAVQIIDYLFRWGIQSLFIEGGAKVLCHFISLGLWDEARIFHGTKVFRRGLKAPVINGRTVSEKKFSSSNLKIIVNEKSAK